MIYDPSMIEELAKKDGKYPRTFEIEIWKDHKKRHGLDMGFVTR